MPLNFITGAPGSGKTEVTKEIALRGYSIYDTDDPGHTGIAGWHNLKTGEYVAGFNELGVTEHLLETHVWKLTSDAVRDFQARSASELIFLCGRLRDAKSIIEVSAHVVFLKVSASTIKERLDKRAKIPGEVEWGKESWQIERSIEVNQQLEEEYRNLGAIMINTEQPIISVVDEIIERTMIP